MASSNASATSSETLAPLDERELRKLRGGLTLFIISMAIPFLVLVNVRFQLAGGYVSPEANQIIGLISIILMVVSGLTVAFGVRAAREERRERLLGYLVTTMLLGLASFVVIGIQVVNQSVSTVEHFGMIFLTTLGGTDLFILFALLALLSVHIRTRKFGVSKQNYWSVESTALFWQFIVVAWFVEYVVLYLL